MTEIASSDTRYWLETESHPIGPFTAGEVHDLLQAGQATWTTRACPVGRSDWRPLLAMPGFGPAPSAQGSVAPSAGTASQGRSPTTAAMPLFDRLLGVGVLITAPLWLLEAGVPVLVGMVWIAAGLRTSWTGFFPSLARQRGRNRFRNRVVGVIFALLGLLLIVMNLK